MFQKTFTIAKTMSGCASKAAPRSLASTDHAQEQLGDVVYVEMPKVGDGFARTNPLDPSNR